MADRVTDDRYSKRLSIRKALADMPIGNRAQLKRWLAQVEGDFSAVVPNG